jgi:hypothetical protein
MDSKMRVDGGDKKMPRHIGPDGTPINVEWESVEIKEILHERPNSYRLSDGAVVEIFPILSQTHVAVDAETGEPVIEEDGSKLRDLNAQVKVDYIEPEDSLETEENDLEEESK